jgi:hypothetical protein
MKVTVALGGDLRQQHILTEDEPEEQIEHPGYFWLAFDWKDLFRHANPAMVSAENDAVSGSKITYPPEAFDT